MATTGTLNYTPVEDIPKIRDRLRAAFASGKSLPIAYRKNQLLQLAYLLKENTERINEAFRIDLGRPILETAVLELNGTIGECVEAYNDVEAWAKPDSVPWSLTFTPMKPKIIKQPKGVGLVIGPFNYPVVCSLGPLVGAIAAGCPCVVKMSELVPNISGLFAELWPKYMDEDLYQIVNGAIPETTALLELQWDHIVFTGSGTVGKIVAAAAAKHLTPTTLELGGQSPVFLDPAHIDMQVATRRLLWGKVINVGQTCTAPNHIFVPAGSQDALVAAFTKTYAEFYPDGAAKSESVSRIVADTHFQRLKGLLDKTQGKVVLGGETDAATRFIAPTVVRDVGLDDPLMRAEIFGPILPIVPVKDYQEALDFTNARDHPLALYVFSDDAKFKERIIGSTQSGAVDVNEVCLHFAVPGLPFGGVGPSGYGSHTGKFSFDTFTHARGSIDNPKWTDLLFGWRYPPYTASKLKSSGSLAPSIPAPRPGPGIAPVSGGGWFSWVSTVIRLRPLAVLVALAAVLTMMNQRSMLSSLSTTSRKLVTRG